MPPILFFEDFEVGQSWKTDLRKISESDVLSFAELTGDSTYLHTDEVLASKGPFGERISHGLLGLSVLIGLVTQMGIVETSIEAFLGVNWSFKGPIFFDDTVYGKLTVLESRKSKKGKGLVTFSVTLLNFSDIVLQEGEITFMIKLKSN
tara:strand:+ start:30860 stop:31306 length:447 start_codon:yes stop_codon:yes gene_type:complete